MNRNQLTHARTVAQYSDNLLEAVIEDLSHRNLRNFRNHDVRWMGERSTAARAERRKRKEGATA
jgi:hypothetical protein